MTKYAVLVAGGSGTRMGTELPKQFLPLRGKPILLYTIDTFLSSFDDLQIILVVAAEFAPLTESIIQSSRDEKRVQWTTGGETRFHSVKNGLKQVPDGSIVFIHDAVRCLVTARLIRACYEEAITKGNVIPVVTATDSIRIEEEGKNKVIDRTTIKLIQTPQTFRSDLIKKAFDVEYRESFTDEATVLEATGTTIHLLEGERTNIKITAPIDLAIAEKILESRALNL